METELQKHKLQYRSRQLLKSITHTEQKVDKSQEIIDLANSQLEKSRTTIERQQYQNVPQLLTKIYVSNRDPTITPKQQQLYDLLQEMNEEDQQKNNKLTPDQL